MRWPKCRRCKAPLDLDNVKWIFVGTAWQPSYSVPCRCGVAMRIRAPRIDWDGVIEHDAFDRLGESELLNLIETSKVDEVIVQDYVQANFARLGFTGIQGPFTRGPDFKVNVDGQWLYAEVEVDYRRYFKHKHHLDANYSECGILILLNPQRPNWRRPQLPQAIKYIDVGHFVDWVADTLKSDSNVGERWTIGRIRRAKQKLLDAEFERHLMRYGVAKGAKDTGRWLSQQLIAGIAKRPTTNILLSRITAGAIKVICLRHFESLARIRKMYPHIYGPN